MCRYIIAHLLFAIFLGCSFLPQAAHSDVLSNPTLYSKAPEAAKDKMREAARQFLQGQCKIFDAMKSNAKASNELIQSAGRDFALAGKDFQTVAQTIEKGDAKFVISEQEALAAAGTLKELGYETPTTFATAARILARASEKAAKNLSLVKYDETVRSNMEVLTNLRSVSGEAAQVFIAISIITALAAA
jgi:hypothetical protein